MKINNNKTYFMCLKCKLNSVTCISNQQWNSKTYQCKCKNYHNSKKDYS